MSLFRKIRAPLFIAMLALTLTCSNLDNITVNADGETVIEGSLLGDLLGPLNFIGFDNFDISQSQEFRNAGYSKDQIDSVRLKVFTVAVTDPASGNFDFLSTISFFAEAEGLPRVEIARFDPVPDGVRSLEMEILDVELRDYAVAESMTITTSATGSSPAEDTTVSAALSLDVDVSVGGAAGCAVSR